MTRHEKPPREDPPEPRAERLQPDLFPSVECCCDECCRFFDMAARWDEPEEPEESKDRDRVRRR